MIYGSNWCQLFIQEWDRNLFHSMDRPEIVSIRNNVIWLNGTTIEEMEKYHRDTVIKCVVEANHKLQKYLEQKERVKQRKLEQKEKPEENVASTAAKIKFD